LIRPINTCINLLVFTVTVLFFLSCSNDAIPESEIVAKVGNRIITVDEFSNSFEFSLQTLRTGDNPRKTYLDFMIRELLIANEGFEKGFNNHKYVTDRMVNRTNNDLLESFYTKYVYGKVNVPEESVKDALKKASIKFRLLIYPTPSLEKAMDVSKIAQKTDLSDYIKNEINKREVKYIEPKNFETDWIDYLDMPPEMFAMIKDLEINRPSQPIPYQDGYAIFQVINLQREAIKSDELEYGPKRKRMYARLFNIESDKIIHHLMDSILTPLNVRVSNETVDKMVEPLFKWIKAGLPIRGSLVKNLNSANDTSAQYLIDLKKLLPEKLLSTEERTLSVEDYFKYMNYYRKVINQSQSYIDLKNRLLTEIGTMVKNTRFIEIARSEGFLDSTKVKDDLELWQEKWTYDIYRAHLTKDIEITEEEMKQFFEERWQELRIANVDTTRFYKYKNDVFNFLKYEKQNELLNKYIKELKEKYTVWINDDVLNTVKLNDDPKSSETAVFVRKNFSGEFLVPTADQTWITF